MQCLVQDFSILMLHEIIVKCLFSDPLCNIRPDMIKIVTTTIPFSLKMSYRHIILLRKLQI